MLAEEKKVYSSEGNFCPLLTTNKNFPVPCMSNCTWSVYTNDPPQHSCAIAELALSLSKQPGLVGILSVPHKDKEAEDVER